MAVLTLKGEEIKAFPPIVREFASYKSVIEGCTEKTVWKSRHGSKKSKPDSGSIL